jgi:hypothetical protein
MTHDTPDLQGEGTMGSRPSQGVFLGWLAIGLLGLMAAFTILVIASGASQGFT